MTQPLNCRAVLAIFRMVDLYRWGAKGSVVAAVAENTIANPEAGTSFVSLSQRALVDLTGLSSRYLPVVLRQLVAERVLERDAGVGTRPAGWRLQPDVARWREVPWREPVSKVAAIHVDFATGALRRGTTGRFVPRRIAAQSDLVPRRRAAENGASAAKARGTNGDFVPRRRAAQTAGLSSFLRDRDLSSEEGGREFDVVDQVVAAITEQTGRRVWGSLLADVVELAEAFDLDEILRTVKAAPPDLQPPKLVQWTCDQLRMAPRGPSPEDLARRLATVERLVVSYTDAGDEVPPELLAELEDLGAVPAPCQNGG